MHPSVHQNIHKVACNCLCSSYCNFWSHNQLGKKFKLLDELSCNKIKNLRLIFFNLVTFLVSFKVLQIIIKSYLVSQHWWSTLAPITIPQKTSFFVNLIQITPISLTRFELMTAKSSILSYPCYNNKNYGNTTLKSQKFQRIFKNWEKSLFEKFKTL